MEYIKSFIVALVTTIIFITAVEIIAPDKPIKKYIKFVLNLILVSVLLNPIVYLFTKGEGEIIGAIKKYEENCVFCGNTKNLSEYKSKLICNKCLSQIAEINSTENK